MTSTSPPALARRRVYRMIRQTREAKGLTQSQVADAMEWSLSKVMRIEKGEVGISASDLRALLAYLDVTDRELIEQLVAEAKATRRPRSALTDEFREAHTPATLKLMQFEAGATAIRHFNSLLVPGVFQTPAYAEAVLREHSEELSADDIDGRLQGRLNRYQSLFERPKPPQYLALLDESVLYREVGGAETMGRQLERLLGLTQPEQTMIRVMPFTSAATIAMMGPFTIVDVGEDENAVLYTESYLEDRLIEQSRDVVRHRKVFEAMWQVAKTDDESAELIRKRVDQLLGSADRL